MVGHPSIRLPRQWSKHVQAGILHAIGLASVAISYARGRATGRRRLRAARGWTLEKTAEVFLVDLQTLMIWMRRLDEDGEPALIQTIERVNRYPDFVRNLVRQLRTLCPAMGTERMALVLARAALALGATTIRRIVRERGEPPEDEPQSGWRRRRVGAKYPGHTWHVDLSAPCRCAR